MLGSLDLRLAIGLTQTVVEENSIIELCSHNMQLKYILFNRLINIYNVLFSHSDNSDITIRTHQN